ncbi:MAG: MarR family transcriptional regulator [Sphingobium sp.]|nr:MAG: MarR family transcriptional regulator [Sphingobium sp.]
MATPLIVDPQETDFALQDRASEALRDLYRRSHRVIDRVMTERGASFARTKLLLLLMEKGALRTTDIAAKYGYAPRTVTEAIDGLERDGLVRREADPDDRRAKRISLTEEGRVVANEAEASRRAFVQSIFCVLGEDEQREIIRLLGKLNDRLAELGG